MEQDYRPGVVTFGNANAFATSATFSANGNYTLRLTASDGQLFSSSDVVIVVNSSNQAPVVNAGPDQTTTLGVADLAGTATDDGLPTGSVVSTTWTKISGPGSVTFANVNALNSKVTFTTGGTYVFRLTASDGMISSVDDVTIVVNPCGTIVAESVTVLANATDDVGVVGVQLQLNGVNWGPELMTAPRSSRGTREEPRMDVTPSAPSRGMQRVIKVMLPCRLPSVIRKGCWRSCRRSNLQLEQPSFVCNDRPA